MPLVPFVELREHIQALLLRVGLTPQRAALSARLTAETDRDGVTTHGIARLPRFVEMVKLGRIDPNAEPELVSSMGAIERWRGNRGPGNLAAFAAMQRACELAKEYGLGAVALADTAHWQRGGTYGWQAAEAGHAAMCWTNTLPNLPAWGGSKPVLGNNPLVLAAPGEHGEHMVLDFAMSQFSYGTLAAYRERGEPLPVVGGWDEQGELTTDPAAIERTQRALPVGFWKGSGLSFVLDILAATLADGKTTREFSTDPLAEIGQSQIFLAFPKGDRYLSEAIRHNVAASVEDLRAAGGRYPGEGTLRTRRQSMQNGVAVSDAVWKAFLEL